MKKPILLLICSCMAVLSFAQFTITGKVVDADTKEALVAASVFAQNTTRGTTTDKDGQFSLYLDKGGYELIISFTGYVSKTINVQKDEGAPLQIEMQKADNSMSEVIIKSSNEVPDGWEKYGQFFIKHFLGETAFADSCTLLNPQALKFLYFRKSDRLKVLAAEPLLIDNRALGYKLRYELDSFVYHFKTDLNSYRGLCLYGIMEGNAAEQAVWKKNRKEAYLGSRLHFMRSYYDSTLKQEGFTVDILSKPGSNRFSRLANPYDTAYYFYDTATDDVELYFPLKVSIGYTGKAPEKKYIEQFNLPAETKVPYSYIDLLDGIIIKPHGFFFDQRSWINQGYWSWKNLADQLPYDYDPDR
jgi:hypothetical protein